MNEDLYIICADLSMRRPGFAAQHYNAEDGSVTVLRKSHVDNSKFSTKCHGRLLGEVAAELILYLRKYQTATLVRERAPIGCFGKTTIKMIATIHKVVGVTDLCAWRSKQRVFEEVAPQTIKKLVTGSAKASKEEVAAAQEKYVGKLEYACDDESDALACGIAWLIQNKYLEEKT